MSAKKRVDSTTASAKLLKTQDCDYWSEIEKQYATYTSSLAYVCFASPTILCAQQGTITRDDCSKFLESLAQDLQSICKSCTTFLQYEQHIELLQKHFNSCALASKGHFALSLVAKIIKYQEDTLQVYDDTKTFQVKINLCNTLNLQVCFGPKQHTINHSSYFKLTLHNLPYTESPTLLNPCALLSFNVKAMTKYEHTNHIMQNDFVKDNLIDVFRSWAWSKDTSTICTKGFKMQLFDGFIEVTRQNLEPTSPFHLIIYLVLALPKSESEFIFQTLLQPLFKHDTPSYIDCGVLLTSHAKYDFFHRIIPAKYQWHETRKTPWGTERRLKHLQLLHMENLLILSTYTGFNLQMSSEDMQKYGFDLQTLCDLNYTNELVHSCKTAWDTELANKLELLC